jgi:DNA (cytosine-5)-methyltransferase 1
MNEDKTPNFLSIFSGAGGLDHGFVRAGFKIIGSAEKVSDRVKTHNFNLNVNYPSVDLENEDEYNAFINRYKERQIDLLVSGFPCQGYTVAGLRNPNDPLNQLYKIIIKTLKHLNIKNFMLENVPSILNMEKGEAIKKIEAEFNDAGYFF